MTENHEMWVRFPSTPPPNKEIGHTVTYFNMTENLLLIYHTVIGLLLMLAYLRFREYSSSQQGVYMSKLESERTVIEAPMSFTGSFKRIWLQVEDSNPAIKVLGVIAILFVWCLVLCWYMVFGIFLIPYRLMRRSQRKSRLQEIQHREMMASRTQ